MRLLPVLLIALFAQGCVQVNSTPCSGDSDCPEGRCRRGACGPYCLDDAECGTEQLCRDGICMARPECTKDQECATGFSCRAGRCQCTGDSACAANEQCLSGQCAPRPRCTQDSDCSALGRRCELTQGLCIPPCDRPADCAPGMNPAAATALYQCTQGTCHLRCLNDATCGNGLICSGGVCEVAACKTRSDCPPDQYCTSATNGRCLVYQECTSTAQCPANYECRGFLPTQCPPGFDCTQLICQELPPCLIDSDCVAVGPNATPAYCADGHCQPSQACAAGKPCPTAKVCVGGTCVPAVCRGLTDCAGGDACVDGKCEPAPLPGDVNDLLLEPATGLLAVGDTLQFRLIAFRLDGSSHPMPTADFQVRDELGQPTTAATINASGALTAVAAGRLVVQASVVGANVPARTATVEVLPTVTAARRVVVVSAATGLPLAGVHVVGCAAPPTSGPCPSPVEQVTDSSGVALFVGFATGPAGFTAASTETRSDTLPRFDAVSVAGTQAVDVLIPLTENPVHGTGGFSASVNFADVHSTGQYWAGFAVLSVGDPTEADLGRLLGDTFYVDIQGVGTNLPVPGSVVLYTSPGFGIPQPIKSRSLGLGQAGARQIIGFAGRSNLSGALLARSLDVFSYAGAMDFGLQTGLSVPHRAHVPDSVDVNKNGLCSNASRCPEGTEDVPDYASFPQLSLRPSREQRVRTELVVPKVPAALDTVVAAAVQESPAGLLPLGFASGAAGAVDASGQRAVAPVSLRSGAPYGGVEAGTPGTWVVAAGLQNGLGAAVGSVTSRLSRSPVLPAKVVVPPFVPIPEQSSYSPNTRSVSLGQPAWSQIASAGGELARVAITSNTARHVVWFPLTPSQTALRVPEVPAGAADPAAQANARLSVVAADLSSTVNAEEALSFPGPNLGALSRFLDGYSRFETQP